MMYRLLLMLALALPLTACKTGNPKPEPSAKSMDELRGSAKWDIDQARTELSELNAVIAAVTDKAQRDEFETQAKHMGTQIDDAAKRIKDYERKADTEGVAGVLMTELADVRAEIEKLRAVVAGGNY